MFFSKVPFVTFKPDNLESIGSNHKWCRTRNLNSRGSYYVVIKYIWHEFHIDVCLRFNWGITWTLTNWKKSASECPCCVHWPLFLRIAVTEGQTPKKLYSAFQICRWLILEPQKSYKRLRLGHVKSLERDHWRGHKIFFMVQHEIPMYDCCHRACRCCRSIMAVQKKLLLRILCQFYFTIKIGALSFFCKSYRSHQTLIFLSTKVIQLMRICSNMGNIKKEWLFYTMWPKEFLPFLMCIIP